MNGTDNGDPKAADDLMPQVYEELRALAGHALRHRDSPTVQPTMLVHEAYLRLVDSSNQDWKSPTHFAAVAGKAVRQVLVDAARARKRLKRGGDQQRVTLSAVGVDVRTAGLDCESLDAALSRLAAVDPRGAKVVEMKFFGGLTEPAIADLLGVSERTVRNDWRTARAWLRLELDRNSIDS